MVCVGAAWDGHFWAWVKRNPLRGLSESLFENNHSGVEVGFIMYNEHRLPPILKDDGTLVWPPSPPSYDIKIFRAGSLLHNRSLEQEMRSSYPAPRPDAWTDVVRLCGSVVAVHASSPVGSGVRDGMVTVDVEAT